MPGDWRYGGRKQPLPYQKIHTKEGDINIMVRPIDISKDSNKKCEHCEHWTGYSSENAKQCKLNGTTKNYWNRCKNFCWRKGLNYINSAENAPAETE